MSEQRGGCGGVDPSKLHLRKELTQIRKAARVLRDPGTSSSCSRTPPPADSSRSVPPPAAVASPSSAVAGSKPCDNGETTRRSGTNRVANSDNGAKQKKVFLHNWRNSCMSSSEKSTAEASPGIEGRRHGDYGSCSDSLSDSARDGAEDFKSGDSYTGQSQSAPVRRRRRDTNMVSSGGMPPILSRRSAANAHKVKSKKLQKQQRQHNMSVRKSMHSRRKLPVNARDKSDDTEDYCDSDDFRRGSAGSPLLSRLRYSNSTHSASKLLVKGSRKDDSSYAYNSTPALSTSSYNNNRYGYNNRNPSTVGSWDCTTVSLNGVDDWTDDDHLGFLGRKGCGIPCYWSRRTTPRHRIYGSSCSPSLSDTLRRKGSSILCGSRKMYSSRHKIASRTAQGVLPLLTNGSSTGSGGRSDDELSTNFGELDLEGLSRLDRRKWSSSCRSEEELELEDIIAGEGKEESSPENIRSLSQKYRPMFFDELIGQKIVVESLTNAASRRRVAPFYLFQGPRGTGKTSAARVFAAALNCLATEEAKPCGICNECTDFLSSKSRDVVKIDGTNKKAVDKIRYLLKNLLVLPQTAAFSRYKVVVIDECHLLPSKMWVAFLKFLEQPLPRVVFIFITNDLDSMPQTVLSRCQKYLFGKIKDNDMVSRLKKISDKENLEVELDALELIALNADGSLRDAETMLDQLSLLGKKITTSLVNELLGVVSDDKLLELLELAMSPDTAETVKRARELLDSGVDPAVLMSQMASLIMDLIAGNYRIADNKPHDLLFGGRSFTEMELERLKHALKLLSDAEKQLRVTSERSTWFTAALLQLGSVSSSDFTQSGSSRRQSSKTTEDDPSSASKEVIAQNHNPDSQCVPEKSTSSSMSIPYNLNSKPTASQLMDSGTSAGSRDDFMVGNMIFRCINSGNLDYIWIQCIERCHSKTLRQLLRAHGKLLSISEVEGSLIAYIAFKDGDIKARVERFLSSITDSIETILRSNVEVRIILFPEYEGPSKPIESSDSLDQRRKEPVSTYKGNNIYGNSGYSHRDSHKEPIKLSRGSLVDSERNLKAGAREYSNCSPSVVSGNFQSTAGSPLLAEGNMKDRRLDMPIRRIESIIRDQNLETAWLQTADSVTRLKPEKNQILPQEGMYRQSHMESMSSKDLSSGHWDDILNHGTIVSNTNDGRAVQNDQISKRVDHYTISPSLLHGSSFMSDFSRDTLGYESGGGTAGCGALFCWNNAKKHKGKVRRATSVRRRFSLFGYVGCGKRVKADV